MAVVGVSQGDGSLSLPVPGQCSICGKDKSRGIASGKGGSLLLSVP